MISYSFERSFILQHPTDNFSPMNGTGSQVEKFEGCLKICFLPCFSWSMLMVRIGDLTSPNTFKLSHNCPIMQLCKIVHAAAKSLVPSADFTASAPKNLFHADVGHLLTLCHFCPNINEHLSHSYLDTSQLHIQIYEYDGRPHSQCKAMSWKGHRLVKSNP